MKRFNPEIELSKIRNGNKKKVIISIFALLVVGILGYSFAIYQVRHTRELVFNTVDEFVKKDIVVSVLIDNESKPEFPRKEDGYVYSDYECENDGVITFDSKNWEFTLKNNKPDKCVIKFSSNPFKANACKDLPMSECLLLEEQHTNKELAYDDPDGNARYIGATPANYIWFNCDDYSNSTEDTCEKWQIIGSFKNIEKVNEDGESMTQQNLIKIRRCNEVERDEWDSNNVNNWETASLQKILNEDYLDPTSGKYTSESRTKAIKSTTLNMIEKVKWNIGQKNNGTGWDGLSFYRLERGTETKDGYPYVWKGKIGLIYPSDYAYATSGNSTGINREECLGIGLNSWSNSPYQSDCAFNSWIMVQSRNVWTLTSTIYHPAGVETIYLGGNVTEYGYSNVEYSVFPTLYLTHDTKIIGGEGTSKNPYTIDTIKKV